MLQALTFNVNFQSGLELHCEMVAPDGYLTKPEFYQGTTEISTESSESGEEVVVEESDTGMYLIIGVIILGVVGVGYYMKVIKGKDEFEDDEEEEAEIGEEVTVEQ